MSPRENTTCQICGSSDLATRPERLRDSETINVLECRACTHVFLDHFDHINEAYFERGEFLLHKPFFKSVEDRQRHYEHENAERMDRVGPLVVNKRILDFGCGAGDLMDKLRPLASSIEGLERTKEFREHLAAKGYTIHETTDDLDGRYDVILMFHVLEHLPDPAEVLKQLATHLAPNGLIYLEVPNVNDALLTLYDIEACGRFLFFRDHLHYFSRSSLARAIQRSGLKLVTLNGHNRFGLANHLYWLRHGKPGGHKIWSFLETPTLFAEYSRTLAAADMSDSLVAQVRP